MPLLKGFPKMLFDGKNQLTFIIRPMLTDKQIQLFTVINHFTVFLFSANGEND